MARRRAPSNWASASAMPITMIPAKMSRRTSRSRVVATGDSSPPATATLRRSPRRGKGAVHQLAVTNASTRVTTA